MTAPQSAPVVPWWKHYGWKGLLFPSFAVLVALLWAVSQLLGHKVDPNALAAAAAQGAQKGAAAQATATTAPPSPVATTPLYDYVWCTHQHPGDLPPCKPVLVWPPTDAARLMIGFQLHPAVDGELSTVQTRLIYDQIRQMPGVDACSMWIAIVIDAGMNANLTVYPNQTAAGQSAVKLVDCTPSGSTKGTVPTEGQS